MATIEERISDRRVLKMLRAGVMEHGTVRRPMMGTQQDGVVSPLLANVYPHRFDPDWQTRGNGVLVRYADDPVVRCATREQAGQALAALKA